MTAAARRRRVEAARRRMREARDILVAVCDDYAAESYKLTAAERDEWRKAVDLCSPLERLLRDRSL